MSRHNIHIRSWAIVWPLAILLSALLANPSWAQTSSATRIEEDWELVIGEPSQNSSAPQVTCLMSPVGGADSLYATFLVNYGNTPTPTAGGLQLQAWNGKTLLTSKQHPDQAVLNTPGEIIRWTQRMQVTSGHLVFEVVNGTSTTWGAFGADESLRVTVANGPQNLDEYSPTVSVNHSGVSFAANRVQSLVLKRVRAYTGEQGEQLLGTDLTERPVYPRKVSGE